MLNVFLNSHREEERPEFIAYPQLCVRTSLFPYGNHILFYSLHVNPLLTGYK